MRRYVNEEFMDDGQFLFRAFPAPVDLDFELHTHDFVEMCYVTEGRGYHLLENDRQLISEGDFFIIQPQTPHGYLRIPGTRFVLNNIIFDPAYLENELSLMARIPSFLHFYYVEPSLRSSIRLERGLHLQPSDRIEVIQMLDRLVREDSTRQEGFQLFIKAVLLQLFIYLSRCFARYEKPSVPLDNEHDLFKQICGMVTRHYAQPFTLQQLSQICGMSQSAFTAKFKRHTGKTFLEYRNGVRVRIAQAMLVKSNEKIVSIAYEAGFGDPSFFHKIFKQQSGMSPEQYRELHKPQKLET